MIDSMARHRDRRSREGGRSLFTRDRIAGRCPTCGQKVSTGEDFVHLHGEVIHTDCAAHRYGGARAAREMWQR